MKQKTAIKVYGIEKIDLWCVYCKKRTKHASGHLGTTCQECDLSWSMLDGGFKRVLAHLRNKENLTWRDIAHITGFTYETIRGYSNTKPWRIYYVLEEKGYFKNPPLIEGLKEEVRE